MVRLKGSLKRLVVQLDGTLSGISPEVTVSP